MLAYDEFGVPLVGAGTNINQPFGFTGYQTDDMSGLYYAQARYYAPELGRFSAEDIIHSGLNWYLYCYGNPLAFVDLNGHYHIPSHYPIHGNTQNQVDPNGNYHIPSHYPIYGNTQLDLSVYGEVYTINDIWEMTKGLGENLFESFLSIARSSSFGGGSGIGLGIEADMGIFGVSLIAKIDTTSARFSNKGLETYAAQEASFAYSILSLNQGYSWSAEKDDIFYPFTDFAAWSTGDGWKDTSGFSNEISLSGGIYLGIGFNYHFSIDLNKLIQNLQQIWGLDSPVLRQKISDNSFCDTNN